MHKGWIALITLGIIGAVVGAVCGIWYLSNIVCIRWEPHATGERCVRHESYISICTSMDSKGHMQSRACTKTRCVKWVPCKRCTESMHKDDAPAERPQVPPNDRC